MLTIICQTHPLEVTSSSTSGPDVRYTTSCSDSGASSRLTLSPLLAIGLSRAVLNTLGQPYAKYMAAPTDYRGLMEGRAQRQLTWRGFAGLRSQPAPPEARPQGGGGSRDELESDELLATTESMWHCHYCVETQDVHNSGYETQ